MRRDLPDFKTEGARTRARLTDAAVRDILDRGRRWDLSETVRVGGAVIFPHIGIETGGHHTATAVHAALDSGARRVLVVGVLHALTEELEAARVRVAEGRDPRREPAWGIQGPGLDGRTDWKREFSLDNFCFLWKAETALRGTDGPELILRYPYLAGGRPETLPGIGELETLLRDDTVVVATGDLFHHGIAYGDPPETAHAPEAGGLDLARARIDEGLAILEQGDHWGYNTHCVSARSDARDVGQILRHLLGPIRGRVLDLVAEDMATHYGKPSPSWVAGALVELKSAENPSTETVART